MGLYHAVLMNLKIIKKEVNEKEKELQEKGTNFKKSKQNFKVKKHSASRALGQRKTQTVPTYTKKRKAEKRRAACNPGRHNLRSWRVQRNTAVQSE